MNTKKKLGIIIQKRRIELGFSQEKLAQATKLHRTYISMLERGLRSPTITTILKISKALDKKLSALLKEL